MIKRLVVLIAAGVAVSLIASGCTGKRAASTVPRTVVFASIEYAPNELALVEWAALVVVATPVGEIQEVPTSKDGLFVNYLQDVRIEEILKGDYAGDTVRVGRAGISSHARPDGLVASDDLRGRLSPGRQILFLKPSLEPGLFQVVGHASGELPLKADGRVGSVRPEAKVFEGLSAAEVRAKISELAGGR